ncbi:MAG: YitT family protein [Muribaculaceae bacterium]
MNETKNIAERLAILAIGLLLMAMGIALCIRAGLGITPISCPPYVLSLALPFTVGQFTMAMHLLLILGQWALLRRRFSPKQWLQLALAFAFGTFIDGSMWITSAIVPQNYVLRLATLILGNASMAVGMYFEIKSNLILVPTDGFVRAVSECTSRAFGNMKIAFDVALLLISVVCSAALLGRIEGIREGTLISAFLVGYLLGVVRKIIGK